MQQTDCLIRLRSSCVSRTNAVPHGGQIQSFGGNKRDFEPGAELNQILYCSCFTTNIGAEAKKFEFFAPVSLAYPAWPRGRCIARISQTRRFIKH